MSAMAAVADVNDTLGSFLHVHLSKELPMLWWALLVFLTSGLVLKQNPCNVALWHSCRPFFHLQISTV